MDGGEKRGSVLGVSCGNPTPLFQLEKGVFHQVPEFVEVFVVLPLVCAISLGRNDYLHLFLFGLVNNRVGIVSTTSQEMLDNEASYEERSLYVIRTGTFCDKSSDRHTMRIHGQMNLGVEPPFVRFMS